MFTIFSTAKAFDGLFRTIQRNAIRSWTLLGEDVQIILFGDDEGTSDICRELGLEHVPDVRVNEFGTPLLSDMFRRAEELARHPILCFVNADVILTDDMLTAVRATADRGLSSFLMVGQRYDVEINEPITFEASWGKDLRDRARRHGELKSEVWIDWFVFTKGVFGELPQFAIGRSGYDNWLIWRAGDRGAPVIDATRAVVLIHQRHDYSHAAGGKRAVWDGEEAKRARELVGSWRHYHSIAFAGLMLTSDVQLVRARGMKYRLARPRRVLSHWLRFTRPLRRRLQGEGVTWRTVPTRIHAAAWRTILAPLARASARPRPLGPFPGWEFGKGSNRGPVWWFRRFLWALGRRLPSAQPIVTTWCGGLEVASYLGNDASRCFFVDGCYEPNEMMILDRLLVPGATFVDIGANEGIYTLLARQSVGPSGTVLAVEPSEREYGRLLENLRLNHFGDVKAHRVAILDRDGEAALRVADPRHAGHNTFGGFIYEGVDVVAEETVRTTTLDELLKAEGIGSVDVVKLDVEGAELRVLQGATAMLAVHRPVLLLELQESSLRQQGGTAALLLRFMEDAGYLVFGFDRGTGYPTVPLKEAGESLNVLAVPQEREALVTSLPSSGLAVP